MALCQREKLKGPQAVAHSTELAPRVEMSERKKQVMKKVVTNLFLDWLYLQPKGAFKNREIAMKGSWEEIHGFDEDATYMVGQLVLSRELENKTAGKSLPGVRINI